MPTWNYCGGDESKLNGHIGVNPVRVIGVINVNRRVSNCGSIGFLEVELTLHDVFCVAFS